MANLTGWHGLILLAIVLLIFGASRLPALAKGVGQSVRIFQREVKPKAADTLDATVGDVSTGTAATGSARSAADGSATEAPGPAAS